MYEKLQCLHTWRPRKLAVTFFFFATDGLSLTKESGGLNLPFRRRKCIRKGEKATSFKNCS